MLTIFGTAIVRTTHVTGLVTDVGILVGLYLRDLIIERRVRKEGMWKLKIFIPLYLGFFSGGCLGYLAVSHIPGTYPLIIPSIVTAWMGIGFTYLRHLHNKQEKAKALLEAQKLEQKRREEAEIEEELAAGEDYEEGSQGEEQEDDFEVDNQPRKFGDPRGLQNGTKSS